MRFKSLTIVSAAIVAGIGGLATPAGSASAASAPAAAQLATQYQVTLKISAKEAVAKEDTVKLTGTVIPRPPEGSKVIVQVKFENQKAWKKAGTAIVKPNGNYKFEDEPESRLDRVYRVVKRTDDKAEGDTSRERALRVIGWAWLTSMTPSASENVFRADKMPINGDDYTHTLFVPTAYQTGFTEFTLGRNCLELETTFGLSDRTETGGRASIQMTNDGVLAYARSFGLGESELKTFDMTDVFRVRIDFAEDIATPATEPSAGAARVLCD